MIESELMLLGAEIDGEGKSVAHPASEDSTRHAGVAFFALSAEDGQKVINRLAMASASMPVAPRRPKVQWVRRFKVRVQHVQTSGSLRHGTVKALVEGRRGRRSNTSATLSA